MALREEFSRAGKRFFRWRSYLPLIMIAVFLPVVMFSGYRGPGGIPKLLWEAFCLLVCFAGLGIRVITVGHVPEGTSGRNTEDQIADTLNTTGIYSVTRNPLYLGNFLMGLGPALFTNLWYLAAIYILAFWLYYERIIFSEEEYLRDKFGQEFLEWAGLTPAFVPKLQRYKSPALPFSLKAVLNKEYNSFFAVVLVMSVFEAARRYAAGRAFGLEIRWIVLLGGSGLIWMILRILRKRTSFSDIKGR